MALGSTLLTITPEDPCATMMVGGVRYEETLAQALPTIGSNIPIVVTAQDGTTKATYYIAVRDDGTSIPVTGASLDKTSLELTVGASEQLKVTVSPGNATDKSETWTSSDLAVAKVDSNSNVEAVGKGSATIAVTTVDGGKTAVCTVTVSTDNKPDPEPTPDPWERRYSPRLPNGTRLARNIYAHSEDECEQKLAQLIQEMKQEIAARKTKAGWKAQCSGGIAPPEH